MPIKRGLKFGHFARNAGRCQVGFQHSDHVVKFKRMARKHEANLRTVNLLMLLMPGLFSSVIFNLLWRKVGLTVFDKVVESFLFAFIIYVSLNLTYGWEPLAQVKKVGNEVVYTLTADSWLFLLSCTPLSCRLYGVQLCIMIFTCGYLES